MRYGEHVFFSQAALATIKAYAQLDPESLEAGGLLFAKIKDGCAYIEIATEPRVTDERGRQSFHPDNDANQRDIEAMFKQGLHWVGDWHTHPEPHPTPSAEDIKAFRDCWEASKPNPLIEVIQGSKSMRVWEVQDEIRRLEAA